MFKSRFAPDILFAIIGGILGFFIAGIPGTVAVLELAAIEISMSFDNAIANSKKLEEMDPLWQHRFMTWGMLVAVGFMRFLFPLLIISFSTGMAPLDNYLAYLGVGNHVENALSLAIQSPDKYATILTAAHTSIAGFGGSFLFLVFLKFFLDEEKDVHWIKVIEAPFSYISKIQDINLEVLQIAITVTGALITTAFIPAGHEVSFLLAVLAGILAHVVTDLIGVALEHYDQQHAAKLATTAVKSGLAGLIYLEVLDASFSFDGVLGALAITNNIWLIMIGLGIGALAVRTMTILLVEKGTLADFRYLEHGAMYSIAALAIIMFSSTVVEIPEAVSGAMSISFILIALISSIIYKKLNPAVDAA